MKPLPLFVAFLFLYGASAVAAEQLIVPMVVDIRHSTPSMPVMNNQEMDPVKVMCTLTTSSQKFGRSDPVIIRLESNADIVEAANLAQAIRELYDHVFIALIREGTPNSKPLLLSIGRDVPSVDLSPLFPSLTMKPSRPNLDQNSARDQQVESIRKYQPGDNK